MKIIFAQLINPDALPQAKANDAALKTILTDVFILLGAIALLMVIVGSLRYVLASGNPEKVKVARSTIIYAVAGLALAAMAATIVNFVLDKA